MISISQEIISISQEMTDISQEMIFVSKETLIISLEMAVVSLDAVIVYKEMVVVSKEMAVISLEMVVVSKVTVFVSLVAEVIPEEAEDISFMFCGIFSVVAPGKYKFPKNAPPSGLFCGTGGNGWRINRTYALPGRAAWHNALLRKVYRGEFYELCFRSKCQRIHLYLL